MLTYSNSSMMNTLNDPLHGITLKTMLEFLVDRYGWKKLGEWIRINCFKNEPNISSSLKFLRKTPWAREKIEHLYLITINKDIVKRHLTGPIDDLGL